MKKRFVIPPAAGRDIACSDASADPERSAIGAKSKDDCGTACLRSEPAPDPIRGRTVVYSIIVIACIAMLPACKRHDPQAAADAAAAQATANEDAAEKSAAAFDDAVSKENWSLAKAQADVLLAQYPGTSAAKRVGLRFEEVKAKAAGIREQTRTAGLWSYNTETVKGGQQLSASIYAKDEIDTDGSGARPVRLIFRDHPEWGRSAYLVLQAGDFDCYGGCRVPVKVDDAAAKMLPASRPKTDEAIAMFIDDEKSLWRMTKDAKTISIEFPTKSVGKKTAVFEVSGLDRGKLPKWD